MSEDQELTNKNIQTRLEALESESTIMTAFFYAVIETCPDTEKLKSSFLAASEHLIANSTNTAVSDDYIRKSIRYRELLMQWIDQRTLNNL